MLKVCAGWQHVFSWKGEGIKIDCKDHRHTHPPLFYKNTRSVKALTHTSALSVSLTLEGHDGARSTSCDGLWVNVLIVSSLELVMGYKDIHLHSGCPEWWAYCVTKTGFDRKSVENVRTVFALSSVEVVVVAKWHAFMCCGEILVVFPVHRKVVTKPG